MDFTDLSQPEGDRATSTAARSAAAPASISGGFWSTYWYNGRIYGSEIARGFDSFALAPTANLSAGEIAAAERVRTERTNAQSQDQFRSGRRRRSRARSAATCRRRCR